MTDKHDERWKQKKRRVMSSHLLEERDQKRYRMSARSPIQIDVHEVEQSVRCKQKKSQPPVETDAHKRYYSVMTRLRKLMIPFLAMGIAAIAWGQTAAPAKAKAAKSAQSAAPAEPVDINAASMSQLLSIPGIGDAYATKIMGGRPYKSKTQLKSRHILPDAVYEKTKDYMVAKQK